MRLALSVEARRGCGYRKIGGLYLVSGGRGVVCDRLPIPLEVCPTCSHGIKQTRGWTWVDTAALVGGVHPQCEDTFACPLCMAPQDLGRSGLLWIGEKFYKSPQDFDREAAALGVSRRIHAIPRGFKVGDTWILFAHPKAIETFVDADVDQGNVGEFPVTAIEERRVWKPGIFKVWLAQRIEKILPESLRGRADRAGHCDRCMIEASGHEWACFEDCPHVLAEKGITPVYVPDDDPDHRGSVYDDDENGDA